MFLTDLHLPMVSPGFLCVCLCARVFLLGLRTCQNTTVSAVKISLNSFVKCVEFFFLIFCMWWWNLHLSVARYPTKQYYHNIYDTIHFECNITIGLVLHCMLWESHISRADPFYQAVSTLHLLVDLKVSGFYYFVIQKVCIGSLYWKFMLWNFAGWLVL